MPAYDVPGVREVLSKLTQTVYLVRDPDTGAVGATTEVDSRCPVLATAPPMPPTCLGSAAFRRAHGVRYAYQAGAMANGIASVDLVVALARQGFLGSFGAAGLTADRITQALDELARRIPGLPFAANLIHSPAEPSVERATAELYISHEVRTVEASAFLGPTPALVRYRAAGFGRDPHGRPVARNHVIAKVSHPEIAEIFLRPAAEPVVRALVEEGALTTEQAELARVLPMADNVTAEADSAGHTDRRPLAVLVPLLCRLRDAISREYGYPIAPWIGAAGGLGTPEAIHAAFALGAEYVVTGSVNQSCVEAGTSTAVKQMLARTELGDCAMAPAADMFEIGAEVQVLKRGTMFAMRAERLRKLYLAYDGLDALPDTERADLERKIFRRPLTEVWRDCEQYFAQRDPAQVDRAVSDPKRRMALVFRWYLGRSSQWATSGEPDRLMDAQIWCGPAMAAFNDWVHGTALADPVNRGVADVASALMAGAAYHERLDRLRAAGARVAPAVAAYLPGSTVPVFATL